MISRIARRIGVVIGIGRLTAATVETGSVQTVQAAFPGSATNGPDLREMPSLQLFGFRSSPKPGADVVAVFLSGDRSKGVVIASGDQRFRITVLASGDSVMEDAFGHAIHMSAAGIAVQGTMTVTGDVIANGISLINHEHDYLPGTGPETPTSPPIAGT